MMFKKKSQAAMEFLMTYGWAILVVLVVIGALAYFGVLDPSKFLPTKCTLTAGYTCDQYLGTDGVFQIRLTNGAGRQIELQNFTLEPDAYTGVCYNDSTKLLKVGETYNLNIDCGGVLGSLDIGQRIKGDVVFMFEDKQSGFTRTARGTVVADAE